MRAAAVPPESPEPERRSGIRQLQPNAGDRGKGAVGSGSPGATVGLDLMRSLADQEIARAEAARGRSRQAFALAAGIFTVVQTVAYGSFVTKLATEGHRTGTLINHTAWAAVALAVCAATMLAAELPLKSSNMSPERILAAVSY